MIKLKIYSFSNVRSLPHTQAVVNAFYHPLINEIQINAGMLESTGYNIEMIRCVLTPSCNELTCPPHPPEKSEQTLIERKS